MTKKKKEVMNNLPVISKLKSKKNKKLFTDKEIKENDILQKLIGVVVKKVWEIKKEFTEEEIKYFAQQANPPRFIQYIIGIIQLVDSQEGEKIPTVERLNKLKRNYTKEERLNLYKKIIVKIVEAESIKAKPNIQNICDSINPDPIYDLRQAFDRWKERNPELYSKIKKEVKTQLNI